MIISDIAQHVYIRFTVFQTFRICSLFCKLWLFRNYYPGDAHHVNYGKHSSNYHFRHGAHSVYKLYSVFKFSKLLFCTFFLFRNYYPGDAHHAFYGKHSLNHHFRHCAHSVYKNYSVLNLFEISVCSAHFDFFEITTPVMGIMLTMANIVSIIISDMAYTVYTRLALFWNFSKLLFVLHVLTFSKLLRRWFASC